MWWMSVSCKKLLRSRIAVVTTALIYSADAASTVVAVKILTPTLFHLGVAQQGRAEQSK